MTLCFCQDPGRRGAFDSPRARPGPPASVSSSMQLQTRPQYPSLDLLSVSSRITETPPLSTRPPPPRVRALSADLSDARSSALAEAVGRCRSGAPRSFFTSRCMLSSFQRYPPPPAGPPLSNPTPPPPPPTPPPPSRVVGCRLVTRGPRPGFAAPTTWPTTAELLWDALLAADLARWLAAVSCFVLCGPRRHSMHEQTRHRSLIVVVVDVVVLHRRRTHGARNARKHSSSLHHLSV
jgi:hypothetical protein